jgi:hypothetical protein
MIKVHRICHHNDNNGFLFHRHRYLSYSELLERKDKLLAITMRNVLKIISDVAHRDCKENELTSGKNYLKKEMDHSLIIPNAGFTDNKTI